MKRFFIAFSLIASVGLLGTLSTNHFYQAKADELSEVSLEEEVSEEENGSLEEKSTIESIVSETSENPTIYDNVKNTAEDVLKVIRGVLEQPIVIAGVSTTLGAILILAFSKLFSVLSKKKVNELIEQMKVLGTKIDNSVSKQDYDQAISEIKELYSVVELLVNSTKNVKVKEKAQALLLEIKPVFDKTQEFIEEKKEEVVEFANEKVGEVSNHAKDSAKSIIDIVNKD